MKINKYPNIVHDIGSIQDSGTGPCEK